MSDEKSDLELLREIHNVVTSSTLIPETRSLDLQFQDNVRMKCAAAIDRGEEIVQAQPELVIMLLDGCYRALYLTDENERLREGIEDIANRVDDWTDHDGIGPREALLALIGDGDAEK